MIAKGIRNRGILPITLMGRCPSGIPAFDFDLNLLTFTQHMAVRTGPNGTFAGAPIVQGALDGTGVSDALSAVSTNLIGNPADPTFYELGDANQGTLVVWVTPQWDGNDGIRHEILDTGNFYFYKETSNLLYANFYDDGGWTTLTVDISAWTAGTSYLLVLRWDCDNTIDGTNYASISINNSHNYGITSALTPMPMATSVIIGNQSAANGADCVLEGLTIYRRVLTANDGTGVGVNFDASGIIDELTAIYAAGAGQDPCLVTGSWGIPLAVPTDSTAPAELATTGQAWSHPHSSSLINQDFSFPWDGGYLGGNWMVYFDGTDDEVNFGSDASIDNIPSGASITIEGWFRIDASGSSMALLNKGTAWNAGWNLIIGSSGTLWMLIDCATTNAVSEAGASAFNLSALEDGKCHHIVAVYDDTGDKKIYFAIDGIWALSYDTQIAGNGAYSGDAAGNLYSGELQGSTWDFQGAHGWIHLSSIRRYTPGTDFIPPRALATDGNTIEAWDCNQGTGNLTASVTSPNNDGVRTGATWIDVWNSHGTPVVPQSLEFYAENDGIDFGSGANIDDLPSADCTIECWVRIPDASSSVEYILTKTDASSSIGWHVRCTAAGLVEALINHATDCSLVSTTAIEDGEWHHIAVDWDVGTLTGRLFIDGVLEDSDTAVGAYSADAAQDCLVNARNAIGTDDTAFAIGPIRLSDTRRYTGNSFVPPQRTDIASTWTLPDANTMMQIEMNDGAGATATDTSASGYNGTITFGTNTRWHNTPDLKIDEPGKCIFANPGYNIGSDLANDGLSIYSEMVDARDYVIRPIIGYPNSSRGQARITIYDVIGAAPLVQFTGPPLTGQHSGANNSATMTDGGEVFPASLVGGTIYNVTDGSSATITAVGGTNQDTITGALAGGTDNDWDTGDTYMIKPPDGWVWAEPIALTTGVNADIQIWLTNMQGAGVLTLHQVEVYDNLIAHGDHEAGAGNPYILTGWTNNGLDPGDTAAEAAIVHSGSQALRWAAGAISEGMYDTPTIAQDAFFAAGFWGVGGGAVLQDIILEASGVGAGVIHSDPTVYQRTGEFTPSWSHNPVVWRAVTANPQMYLMADTGAINRYTDDAYVFLLDAVTLTVTPRTYANSLETIAAVQGLCIDGEDDCTQPVTRLRATRGRFRFRVLFKTDPADWFDFGQALCPIVYQWENANNYIFLAVTAADTIRLEYNAQGAGAVGGNWTPTGLVAGTWYTFWVTYTAGYCRLTVDGINVIDLAGFAFATDPSVAVDWGNRYDGVFALDGLIAPP